MASVLTPTRIAGVQDTTFGNKKIKVRDVVIDTGTYVTGGNTITALSVGLKRIDIVIFGTQVMTDGTAGATANPIGIRYAADGTSVTVQQYESGASGAALGEKTNTEATHANATFRVIFMGY